ncbi:DUF6452 family protein, partial [Lutibacter sp.]|uniref:DUF6452 family protein n=1 Tax=Lutibacter sp. TaxID=1925666 RepID=UPI0034A0AADE
MKKHITLLVIAFALIISCEKDDICLENTTPNLMLKFYNFENDTLVKTIKIDSIRVLNKGLISNYTAKSFDSIQIPLDINQYTTSYQITSGNLADTIYFSYDRNDIFVSRSCGYKTNFENLAIDSTT